MAVFEDGYSQKLSHILRRAIVHEPTEAWLEVVKTHRLTSSGDSAEDTACGFEGPLDNVIVATDEFFDSELFAADVEPEKDAGVALEAGL